MGGRFLLVAGTVILLTACGDSLFSTLDDPREVELETVVSGAILRPGDEISLQLIYGDDTVQPVTSMSLELRNTDGSVVQALDYNATMLTASELAPLALDDHPHGVYRLVVEVWRNGSELINTERQVFLTAEPPVITGMTIFPSRLSREASAVALAEITGNGSQRPYLRWSMAQRSVSEGYLADGFDRAVFPGGSATGAYTIRLEVFPWGPEEGVHTDLGTTIVQTGDVIVREEDSSRIHQLVEDGVLVHYSFAGHLRSSIPPGPDMDGDLTARAGEGAFLDVVDQRLGYRLRDAATITIPATAFPARAETSTELDVRYKRIADTSGVMLRMRDEGEDGWPDLAVHDLSPEGGLVLRFGDQESVLSERESLGGIRLRLILRNADGMYEAALELDQGPALVLRAPSGAIQENGGVAHESGGELRPGTIVFGGDEGTDMLVSEVAIKGPSEARLHALNALVYIQEITESVGERARTVVALGPGPGNGEPDPFQVEAGEQVDFSQVLHRDHRISVTSGETTVATLRFDRDGITLLDTDGNEVYLIDHGAITEPVFTVNYGSVLTLESDEETLVLTVPGDERDVWFELGALDEQIETFGSLAILTVPDEDI